jgi:hypothetical protein
MEMFKKGWKMPEGKWDTKDNRDQSWKYYVVWCYEFGFDDLGTAAILEMFNRDPDQLPLLWAKGSCLTHDYKNIAYLKTREISKRIISENIARGVKIDLLIRAKAVLDEISAREP